MKKYIFPWLLLLLLPLQACSKPEPQAQSPWVKGKDYEVIADQATKQPQVLEFFSFWCPHCFEFEPMVKTLRQQLDKEGVAFKRVHVNFMGFATKKAQDAATRSVMVARALQREYPLEKAIFDYLHVQHAPITQLRDLKNLFIINGVDADQFDQLVDSDQVTTQFEANNNLLKQYNEALKFVPTFIINGKYKVLYPEGSSKESISKLIRWLSKQS